MNRARGYKIRLGFLLVLVLLAWALALVRLGERSFWGDEGHTAYLARQTNAGNLVETLRQVNNPDTSVWNWTVMDSPLHTFLMMGAVRLSSSEMVIRLPSAMAAVLTLPVLYLLGCRLFSRTAGLGGAFLLAISPFALGYAQEARTYALLEFLACLSLLLLIQALNRRRWHWWAGFVLAASAMLYCHFFALFVLGAEVMWATLLLLRQSWAERRLKPFVPGPVASLLAIALLYAPWVPSLISFWERARSDTRVLLSGFRSFELSLGFFRDMFAVFGARAYGWQIWVFGGSFGLGLVALLIRKRWRTLSLLALWFGLPIVVLAVVQSERFFDYRYLIFLLPLFLLVTAEGISAAASLVTSLPFRLPLRQAQPILAVGLIALIFVPANAPALDRHCRWEKENWRGIAEFAKDNLLADEAIFVSPYIWAQPLLYYQPSLRLHLVEGSQPQQLQRAARQYAGVWYMRHSARMGDPTGKLTTWTTAQGFRLLIDSKACGWGIHVYYRRFDDLAPGREADLLHKAAIFCPTDPRFRSSAGQPGGE